MHVLLPLGGVVAACLLAGCATNDSSRTDSTASAGLIDSSSDSSTPLAGSGARLFVHGMSCPKCVSNVDLTLARLTGVSRSAINMRDGIVDVTFSDAGPPSPRELARAVDDAGLTLVRIEAVP